MGVMGVMRFAAVIAVAMLGGCAGALSIANGTALGLSTATLACDWGQTRTVAAAGWPGIYEENPIMGTKPSPRAVDLYFAVMVVANILAWRFMPRRWRWAIPIVVTVWQVVVIARNGARADRIGVDFGVCGFGFDTSRLDERLAPAHR
jgi:hypothetical protein